MTKELLGNADVCAPLESETSTNIEDYVNKSLVILRKAHNSHDNELVRECLANSRHAAVTWYHRTDDQTKEFVKLVLRLPQMQPFHMEGGWNEIHYQKDGTSRPRSVEEVNRCLSDRNQSCVAINQRVDEILQELWPGEKWQEYEQFPSSINDSVSVTPDHYDEVYFDGGGRIIVVVCVQGDGLLWFHNLQTKKVHCALVEEGDIYFFRDDLRLTWVHGVANMREVEQQEDTHRITFTKRYGLLGKTDRMQQVRLYQPEVFRGAWEAEQPFRYITADKDWVTTFPYTVCTKRGCPKRHLITRDLVCKKCKTQLRPHCSCAGDVCKHQRSPGVRGLLTCGVLKNMHVKNFLPQLVPMIRAFPYPAVFYVRREARG